MKKKFTIVISMILILVLSGCSDFHNGERPTDFPDTRWVSVSPDIWFEIVGFDVEKNKTPNPIGQAIYNDKIVSFIVEFDHGRSIYLRSNDSGKYKSLFIGSCKFSDTKLIVTVDKERDLVFKGEVDKITFVKEDVESSE